MENYNYQIRIDSSSNLSKHVQIARWLMLDIEKGFLKAGTKLPSITQMSKRIGVSRDTLEKAYNSLKKEGYIASTPGKGNFVSRGPDPSVKVLMVFNKLSSYKKEVYEEFVNVLGDKVEVDFKVYNYDPEHFQEIMQTNKGRYHYYVLMPHFFRGVTVEMYLDMLRDIPDSQLVVLDREVHLEKSFINVYQDFALDIYEALLPQTELFSKYKGVTLLFSAQSHHPLEIIDGIKEFCTIQNLDFQVISDVNELQIVKGQAYIALTENELAILVKKIRSIPFKLGEDVGVLSFNETVLKELLGITVVSTDFPAMGRSAAQMIVKGERRKLRNPFSFIKRDSL